MNKLRVNTVVWLKGDSDTWTIIQTMNRDGDVRVMNNRTGKTLSRFHKNVILFK